MPRPITQTITLSAAVGNAVCASQTPLAAGSLAINGANSAAGVYTAPLNTPRHLIITTAANESTKTFTITGTDRNGSEMTYSTSGAASATTTVYPVNFKTITGVSVSAATAGAITVGFAAAANTGWIPMDRYSEDEFGVGVVLSSGAALTWTLQTTMDDLQAAGMKESAINYLSSGTIGGMASAQHTVSQVVTGIRFLVNAWTGGTATFTVLQKPC